MKNRWSEIASALSRVLLVACVASAAAAQDERTVPLIWNDADLEEFLDPGRLEADCKPAGWKEPGVTTKAIQGHPFGLTQSSNEKTALITFLRGL